MAGYVGTEYLYRMEHLSVGLKKLGAKVFLRLRVHSLDTLPNMKKIKENMQLLVVLVIVMKDLG